MSVQAISWVIDHSQHKGSRLVVLLMIANHAHGDGTGSFPSLETLARESRITTRQVTTILGILERSREVIIEQGKGPHKSNLYTLPLQQHTLPLEKISSRRKQELSTRSSPPETSTKPSLTILKENRPEAARFWDQAKLRETELLVSEENQNPERQFNHIRNSDSELQQPTGKRPVEPISAAMPTRTEAGYKPRTPLEAELYRGVYGRAVNNAFVDCRRLTLDEQLADCVRAGVTSLVTNRVARIAQSGLAAEQIERLTLSRLAVGKQALFALGNFSQRQRLTTAAVVRVIVEETAKLLGDAAAHDPVVEVTS
jgi:hypothetical protein